MEFAQDKHGYTLIRISTQFLEDNDCMTIEKIKRSITQYKYFASKRDEYARVKKQKKDAKKLVADKEAAEDLRQHIADVLAEPLEFKFGF